MKILIITDSLGLPRINDGVITSWVELLVEKRRGDIVYTYCFPGLSIQHLLYQDQPGYRWLSTWKPDLIVIQMGVVDAVRRALNNAERNLLKKAPKYIMGVARKILSGNHYRLSKARDIHLGSIEDYTFFINDLKKNAGCPIVFIKIAPPGKRMRENTHNAESDIKRYNDAIESFADETFLFLDPYRNDEMDSLLLEDGHHLNREGVMKVFEAVNNAIEDIMS